ncbi:LysE family translocator [Marinomonas mediterranea]|uniref:Lysine exporter protein (LYSE/YGGA) n=1 Tax=Marinomonas mediterranea (strain ATCC 700492 / JCM 21426 / NBRC 103028 / MMB-1) TaxID=717774 RepID=F2K1K0_MARM1|nr:LysE family translocator [Marinomonas mediterranea]ADZ92230.1 Lysine exporter protein (LYSE/YGGA) [Marinomonas mediterranea MMB-1]WCN10187.1 LysE family transporter [Marinomonas mediterranea]WCN18288.1 LysE family transporter [Marinomonas mediterranea MMB-1]
MSFSVWLALVPFLTLLALTPGPNNVTSMYNGIYQGVLPATIGATGRNLAFVILMSVSAVGLGAVIVSSAFWFNVVKWFGVFYLLYLGIKTWRAPVTQVDETSSFSRSSSSMLPLIRQEFFIAISNPKAILIFTAIFPQLIDVAMPLAPQFFIIGITFLLAEYFSACMYAYFGMQLRRYLSSARWISRVNKAIASLFIFAGSVLASSSR